MNDDGSGDGRSVTNGLMWVGEMVAASGWEGRAVAVMSLGAPVTRSINRATARLVGLGVPVVVASGNQVRARARARAARGGVEARALAAAPRRPRRGSIGHRSIRGSCNGPRRAARTHQPTRAIDGQPTRAIDGAAQGDDACAYSPASAPEAITVAASNQHARFAAHIFELGRVRRAPRTR